MTKSQIKQELRRSACEDDAPAVEVSHPAFYSLREFMGWNQFCTAMPNDDCRTFFLLVAEAI